MSNKKLPNITLEGVQIIYKNFEGRQTPYNHQGERNFNVVIRDEETAKDLISQGYNVKELPPLEEGDPLVWKLKIKVNYGSRYPPRITLVRPLSATQTPLDEDTVRMLDFVPIKHIDIEWSPFQWEMNGNRGVKPYANVIFAIVDETSLDLKYAEMEHTG